MCCQYYENLDIEFAVSAKTLVDLKMMPGRVAKQASYKGGFPRMNEDVRVAAVSVEWGLEVCATRGQ